MDVTFNQLVESVYELALRERVKHIGMESFCTDLSGALAYLVLPSVLEQYEPAEKVCCQKYWDSTIPATRSYEFVYPLNLDEYKDVQIRQKANELNFIGRETDFAVFAAKNLQHPYYHELKVYLLIRNAFLAYLKTRVQSSANNCYRLMNTGETMNAEQLAEEIAVFEEAVLVCIVETIHQRYNYNLKEVRDFCYLMYRNKSDSPEAWTAVVMEAISLPDRVLEQIKANDYSLNRYSSKMFQNLKSDAMMFLAQVYEMVYHEI